jgi:Threonylcarbamoyl adenosine biosynthesis protein TsaE
MDMYRLGSTDDLSPLNLQHVFRNCISLIEWPERVSGLLPEGRLDVHLTIVPSEPSDVSSMVNGNDDENENPNALRTMVLRPRGELWTNRVLQLVEDGSLDDLLV